MAAKEYHQLLSAIELHFQFPFCWRASYKPSVAHKLLAQCTSTYTESANSVAC